VSYARKQPGASHVYVYATGALVDGGGGGRFAIELQDYVCQDCALAVAGSVHCDTPEAMARHLEAHVSAGHDVPGAALERLRAEATGGGA
jgi:hypothetical protein